MKKNGKWQERKAENKWGGMFQYPRKERISRSIMSNMKQHIEMFNKANAVVPSPYSLSPYQYMEPNFQLPEPASL